jgi:hypothetical protein
LNGTAKGLGSLGEQTDLIGKTRMSIPAQLTGIMYRTFLIELCKRRNVRRYLEVGVKSGHNLSGIPCEVAIGVDPSFAIDSNVCQGKSTVHLYNTTSDRFFADVDVCSILGGPVELAFLDGLHLFEYLLRDLYKTESACSKESVIAMHDCLPLCEEMTSRAVDTGGVKEGPFKGYWTGEAWKIVPVLKKYRPDLTILLVDCPPTGLVLITGLKPSSSTLRDHYLEIVKEFREVPNDRSSLDQLFAENVIVSSAEILQGHDHSLWLQL